MENVSIFEGDEPNGTLAVVRMHDLSGGKKIIVKFEAEWHPGWYDPHNDDFGHDTIAIIDKITIDHALMIEGEINRIGTCFEGVSGGIRECRDALMKFIGNMLKKSPYEDFPKMDSDPEE